jgi:hypothetical protein
MSENHNKNYYAFKKSIEDNISIVVCDNTNIKQKEYERYVKCAKEGGYFVIGATFIPEKESEFYFKNNTHGVPLETIDKMKNALNSNIESSGVDISFSDGNRDVLTSKITSFVKGKLNRSQ